MRPQSAKKARGNSARRQAETDLGRDSDGNGCCWRCGKFGPVNGHERLGRAQGGDPTKPDCNLCPACNSWCEDNPVEAALTGWKISRKTLPYVSLEPWQAFNTRGERVTFGTLPPFGRPTSTDDAYLRDVWGRP